jgi:hypothetical protein
MNDTPERYDAEADTMKVIVWLFVGFMAVGGVAGLLIVRGCR